MDADLDTLATALYVTTTPQVAPPSGTRVVESLGTDEVHADRTTAHDFALIHRDTPVTKQSWQAPTGHEGSGSCGGDADPRPTRRSR